MSEYKRKCVNWLQTFSEWTLPRSEAPESFIFWTGLFTLSSAIRRKVRIPAEGLLGSWEASPNLYILFIAPAGRARKSTTANYAEDLIESIPTLTRAPELITKESLLNQLVKSDDASMSIIAPEFGEFIVKSGPTMFGFLTNMFDGKRHISANTLSRGAEFAERPCINLLGATTPEWVAENMPESVIGGGFASRVIFIYEERVRRRKLFYDDLDFKKILKLRQDLIDDLNHIATEIAGDFKLTKEAHDFAETWYEENADEGYDNSHKLSGYFERKPAHVFKVAMLLHIARSDELILDKKDLEDAIKVLELLEEQLPKVFESVGKNPYTVDMYRLLNYIIEKGRCLKKEVLQNFMHAATPKVLEELIEGLVDSGYIIQTVEDMKAYLEYNDQMQLIKVDDETEEELPA